MKRILCMLLLASSGLVMAQTQTSEILVTMNGKKVKYDQKMSTDDRNNLTNKVAGMLIYNTTTKSHECWDGSVWISYASGGSGNPSSGGAAEILNYDCSGVATGTMTAGTAITLNSVKKTIIANVKTAGTYTISATANGVTFTKTGEFLSTGNQTVELVAIVGNIPTVGGVISYTLASTPTCSFNMTVGSTIPPGGGGSGYQPEISVTGRVWLDRNMGATQPASANVKESIGSLYQWGRGNDGHQLVTWNGMNTVSAKSPTTSGIYPGSSASPGHGSFIIGTGTAYDYDGGTWDWRTIPINDLWSNPAYNSVANPCPAGYRVPTAPELLREIVANGVNGWGGLTAGWHTGPSAYSRTPFGPVGSFYYDGDWFNTPTLMWTSTPSGSGAAMAWNGMTRDNHNYVVEPARQFAGYNRRFGAVVRCIKD